MSGWWVIGALVYLVVGMVLVWHGSE